MVTGYQINIQKSIVFLYTSRKHRDTKILNSMSYNCSQKMKYLDGNPTKYVQDLYIKNYKTLIKEIKGISKGRDIAYLWTGRFKVK